MKTSKTLTAEQEWPELDAIATPIFESVARKINAIQINHIETSCPYIRQCVLEMVIKKLNEVV